MEHIKMTSSTLKKFFGILIPIPIISLAIAWAIAAYNHCHVLAILFGFANESITIFEDVNIAINKVGLLFFIILIATQTYLFWQTRKLFASYSVGKIFTHKNSKALYRIAVSFLALTLISVILITICSIFLLSKHIIEFRSLIITAGILQGCNIVISIVVLVVSWVVEEGRLIKEEHEHTI